MLELDNLTVKEVSQALYNESGFLGLSDGLSSDMRALEEADNADAHRAIDYFVLHIMFNAN